MQVEVTIINQNITLLVASTTQMIGNDPWGAQWTPKWGPKKD
jgi:hypothetical protein